jgi:hypothetical protein
LKVKLSCIHIWKQLLYNNIFSKVSRQREIKG